MERYKLGKPLKRWNDNAQTITFIVTEDCNLRCKYCYIIHKASNIKMNFDVAKKFIDYVLSDKINKQEAVILEFIGGEPLLEIELIDRICDYFKLKAYEVNSNWYWNYRINISTNGVNYSDKSVQHFIQKNKGKLNIGISIDGTKEKHDAQRVFPDGSGSYEIIEKNIPLWISQFGGHTKATFSHDDLKYLKESIISLWNKGITEVAANVVFEDAWKDGDDQLLEEQLNSLADYALENKLYNKYLCTFFDENIGGFYNEGDLKKTWCGAGKMLALGPNGNIYPCVRYKDYSLNKHPEWTFGNVNDGIDMERVRPFLTVTARLQSDNDCINCGAAKGCAYCQGFSYDEAEVPTNFTRAKYICKMHKARVRANDYYFSKLYNLYGIEKAEQKKTERKRMHFLLSDDYITYCQHENNVNKYNAMQDRSILDGLKYARYNFFDVIFVHSKSKFDFNFMKEFDAYHIQHIVPVKFYREACHLKDYILVFEKDDLQMTLSNLTECQINVDSHDISKLSDYVKRLFAMTRTVKINIVNLDRNFDEIEYSKQLTDIVYQLIELNKNLKANNRYKINYVDDYKMQDNFSLHSKCEAGYRNFAYAPNGNLYVCPAYYSANPINSIGSIQNETIKFKGMHLYQPDYQPLCKNCDVHNCSNCIFLNEQVTREVNVPPSFQCRKSIIERNAASLYMKLKYGDSKLLPLEYNDPIVRLIAENNTALGIYKPNA